MQKKEISKIITRQNEIREEMQFFAALPLEEYMNSDWNLKGRLFSLISEYFELAKRYREIVENSQSHNL